jgi:hypothetical protein
MPNEPYPAVGNTLSTSRAAHSGTNWVTGSGYSACFPPLLLPEARCL